MKLAIGLTRWFILATIAGIASAGPLEDAASAHERGDDATAVKLLLPLAEWGDVQAQFTLGFIYDTAKEIPQDDAEAAKWYSRAADKGIAGAQYNLGAMYAEGHGVSQNYVEAYKWLSVAALGFQAPDRSGAIKMRDLVATKMTPEQIAEAQKLVREWKPK
jgi:TPR repeat protein